MFVLVVYFHNFFFVCNFADSLGANTVLLQGIHGFVDFTLIDDYAETPAHVESPKHLLVGDGVAEFRSGFLDEGKNWLWTEIVKLEADSP